MSHATSLGNKQKQTEDRKTFFSYPILCPLCHIHQRKQTKMKFCAIEDLFQCSMSSECCQKKAFTKRGILIAQVHNTELKWSIKPCIFRKKKVSKALRKKLVQ